MKPQALHAFGALPAVLAAPSSGLSALNLVAKYFLCPFIARSAWAISLPKSWK
ncbi:hypothetical protein D9M69_645060 [compost metagenome]